MFEDEKEEFLPPREEEVPSRLAKRWDEREKRQGMMRCGKCKKQILASSSFCAYCGDPVEMPGRIGVGVTVFLLLAGLIFLLSRIFT